MRHLHPTLNTLAVAAFAVAAAIALAACNGASGYGSTGGAGGGASAPAAPASGATVSTQDIGGRNVLVGSNGNVLYASDQERASGSVLCTSGGCLSFWKPLTIGGGTPTGTVSGGSLGVVTRPDGTRQVALDGIPLYSFANDSAGQINGDGLSDTFDGQTLTWHAVAADGQQAAPAAPVSTGAPSRYGY